MIVVDASAVLEVLIGSEDSQKILDRLLDAEELHAPHLIEVEVTQVLRRFVLSNRLTFEGAKAALVEFRNLGVHLHPHTDFLDRMLDLRNTLTAYDAAYVALAEAMTIPLITHDQKIEGASGHQARIELV